MALSQPTWLSHAPLRLLQQYISLPLVEQLLVQHSVASERTRKLPATFLVYYLIAACLYSQQSFREVLRIIVDLLIVRAGRRLIDPAETLPTRSAVTQARLRLGSAFMQDLFTHIVRPCATPETPGAFFKHWRLVIMDGTLLALRDTVANFLHFDGPGKSIGGGSFPMLSLVVLIECGTHLIFGAVMAPYRTGEAPLAESLLSHLRKGMLCLLDREYIGYPWWQAARRTSADFVIRVRKNMKFPVHQLLPDGSFLSYLVPPPALKRHGARALRVRIVEYRVTGSQEVYRLMTSILDPEAASAQELAALYHERWEVEITLREVKASLRGGSLALLRSKTPELVHQEVYSYLLAHYVVRRAIMDSAHQEDLDTDVLSFQHALNVIRRRLPQWGDSGAVRTQRRLFQALLWEILEEHVSSSRGATVPRGVRRYSKYAIRPQGPTTPRKYDWTVTILHAA